MRLEKTQGHWRVCSSAFLCETNASAFALHLYKFSYGQSYFSFSKKNYGSRMGSGIGSRFGVQKGGPCFVNTHLSPQSLLLTRYLIVRTASQGRILKFYSYSRIDGIGSIK